MVQSFAAKVVVVVALVDALARAARAAPAARAARAVFRVLLGGAAAQPRPVGSGETFCFLTFATVALHCAVAPFRAAGEASWEIAA